jgi:hypothetical protein
MRFSSPFYRYGPFAPSKTEDVEHVRGASYYLAAADGGHRTCWLRP